MKNLVCDVTVYRSADHFQSVLIDNSIDTCKGYRKSISFFPKWNEISKTAVYGVSEEDVK